VRSAADAAALIVDIGLRNLKIDVLTQARTRIERTREAYP
jgi:hypothetical protein